jgi:hypothetical protein
MGRTGWRRPFALSPFRPFAYAPLMMDPRPDSSSHTRTGAWLFVWFACFYLLTSPGHIPSPDGTLMYLVTEGLVERGSPALRDEGEGWSFWHTELGTDGRRYSIYGLGPSLLAVPFYLVGRGLEAIAPEESRPVFDRPLKLFHPRDFSRYVRTFGVSLTNVFVSAAAVWLLFAAALSLGFGRGVSLVLAFLMGLASPLWPYSKTFFGEPMAASALLVFLLLAVRYRNSGRASFLFGAGLALSAMMLIKVAHAVYLAAAVPWMVTVVRRRAAGPIRALGLFALGLGSMLPVILAYNYVRFGTILETGYSSKIDFTHPFVRGFAGLLVSPGRGLLLYFPLAAAAILLLVLRWRKDAALHGWILGMLGITALFYAKWWSWEGGWCWGPRFFVPILPLLMLPLGYGFEGWRRHRVWAGVLLVVAVASAVVAFSGTLVSFDDYYTLMKAQYGILRQPYYPDMRWSWQWAPILRYWTFPHKNYYFLTAALTTPGAGFWRAGFAVSAGLLAAASFFLIRGLRRHQTKPVAVKKQGC